jgi:hypothetical protein
VQISEQLDEATLELVGAKCINSNCAKETPAGSPKCDCCFRSHCWFCTAELRGNPWSFKLAAFREEYKALQKKRQPYICPDCAKMPQSRSGLLDAKATPPLHDDVVRVTCEPRQWYAIDVHTHKDIMAAKHIPRPANM